jgi:hypothetical protein
MIAVFAVSAAALLQGDIHVHGHGALVIGAEADGRVEAQLDVPAESLWGFEHAAQTDAERAAMATAETRLRAGGLIAFSPAANCTLESVMIDSPGADQTDQDHFGHEKRAHDHDHDDHHDDADAYGHQDVSVRFHFDCGSSDRIRDISTTLFDAFERLEVLDVVYVDARQQAGFELTPQTTSYRLR